MTYRYIPCPTKNEPSPVDLSTSETSNLCFEKNLLQRRSCAAEPKHLSGWLGKCGWGARSADGLHTPAARNTPSQACASSSSTAFCAFDSLRLLLIQRSVLLTFDKVAKGG